MLSKEKLMKLKMNEQKTFSKFQAGGFKPTTSALFSFKGFDFLFEPHELGVTVTRVTKEKAAELNEEWNKIENMFQ